MLLNLFLFAAQWSFVGDEPVYSFIGPALEAIATDGRMERPLGKDARLKQQRIDEYRRCRERAERTGKAVYRSDGLAGDALPKGLYELIRQDDDVYYREVEPAGVPIPKPDPATIRDFRTVDDCPT